MDIKDYHYRQPIEYESNYKVDDNDKVTYSTVKHLQLLNERVESYHNTIYNLLNDRNRGKLFGFSKYQDTLLKLQDDHIVSLIERIRALEEENQSLEQRLKHNERITRGF